MKVNYEIFTIFQASNMKQRLEELEKKRGVATIAPVDAVNMYPPVKLAIIRKAARFLEKTYHSNQENVYP